MPLDGFTLRYVMQELAETLTGGHIDKIQQPDKTALLLTVRKAGRNHKLLISISPNASRIGLTRAAYENPPEPPMFCMLLRRRLVGGRIAQIRQIRCDRVVILDILNEDELGVLSELSLVCELTGRNSNIILTDGSGKIIDAARRVDASMNRVREILSGLMYIPPPPQDKLDPFTPEARGYVAWLAPQGPTPRAVTAELEGVGTVTAAEIIARPLDFARELDPHVLLGENGDAVDALPFRFASMPELRQRKAESMSSALEECFAAKDARERMERRTASLRKVVENHIDRIEKKKSILYDAMSRGPDIEAEQRLGELITANIYRIKRGMEAVAVEDFYCEGSPLITIKLDPILTPSGNAQTRFKRARKMKNALTMAEGQMKNADESLAILLNLRQDIETCANELDIDEVREALISQGIIRLNKTRRGRRPRRPDGKPSVFVSPDGIEILVGRTSSQNDRLTQSSQGEWTWLHAKDMPGSHVIIRHAGEVPPDTLTIALKLAAQYSRGRNGTNVPIDVTLRKHVRKPSGSPTGFVIYTNQKTYYVNPSTDR